MMTAPDQRHFIANTALIPTLPRPTIRLRMVSAYSNAVRGPAGDSHHNSTLGLQKYFSHTTSLELLSFKNEASFFYLVYL